MLEERQLRTKSIAERRKERDELERKRLREIDEKRKLADEFYNRETLKTGPVDLKSMGYKSDADLGENQIFQMILFFEIHYSSL